MDSERINLKKKRIRRFFLRLGGEEEEDEEKEEQRQEALESGLTYIQMKLPIEKITEEMEKNVRESIEPHIKQAKIRKVNEENLVKVMNIYNRAWMTTNTPFSPIELEDLRKIYEYPHTVIMIAKLYGKDVGFIILDFEGDHQQFGVIAGLGVLPQYQRRGLGRAMAIAAWDEFKERDVEELRCEVYEKNTVAYNFIKAIGFEEYGREKYTTADFREPDSLVS
ncbi:MAG: GNAT family N-acetyltransferase [Promethearchaeia archaeon]